MARIGELMGPNGEVMHPKTSASVVYLEDGRSVEQVLSDDIDYGNVVFQDNSYKFDSDVEDDFAKTVVIKGQTYQNILPEPSTHVLTSNKEMFKINEGLDPNVEIVDGVSKSAILSGQTLVNLATHSKRKTINVQNLSESDGRLTWNTTASWGKVGFTIQGKANTTYCIRYSDKHETLGFYVRFVDDVHGTGHSITVLNSICRKFTTDETGIFTLTLEQGSATTDSWIKNFMLLEYVEGMENWDIPYFEGMASCKMPVLRTIGKNLVSYLPKITVNGLTFTQGESISEVIVNGTCQVDTMDYYIANKDIHSDLSKVLNNAPVGTKFYLSNSLGKNCYFGVVRKGKTETEWSGTNPTTYIVKEGDSDAKAFIRFKQGDTYDNEKLKIQLEVGTEATDYEPYKTNILHTTNLLSNTTLTQGCINTDGSLTTSGESASYSVFTEIIPVKPNTEYYIATDNADITYDRIAYYNSSKTFMRRSDTLYASKSTSLTIPNDTYYIRIAFYQGSGIQITPQQLGNAVCQEMVVLRSLPNGVKDTLNLNTGEYVQRIGEINLSTSSSAMWWQSGYTNDTLLSVGSGSFTSLKANSFLICNVLPSQKGQYNVLYNIDVDSEKNLRINVPKTIANDVSGFMSWLKSNNVIIVGELETPIVKTVDVSSSGNWEKVVLDGSETGWSNSYSEWANKVFCLNNSYLPNVIKPTSIYGTYVMCDKLRGYTIQWLCAELGRTGVALHSWASGYLQIAINGVNTVDELKLYLSQNPVTVWYQTATTLDSTQVKQPIFFKDGHIQLSSGADHSLTPTLDYQAKTSNSYVMDLMKTNIKYTMKAKTASGTFTIDGTSYGAGTNGTFTTPSSMTNKLLVMSNKTNTEVMILEGDVTDKTMPYFKGIKSAFEGEDKIEVLSQGKNLFDVNEVQTNDRTRGAWETRIEGNKIYSMRVTSQVSGGEFGAFIQIPVKPSVEYVYKFDFTSTDPNLEDPQVYIYNNSSIWGELLSSNGGKTTKFTTKANTQFITIGLNYRSDVQKGTEFCTYNAILIETTQARDYEPHKSNSTKIPLLSPLRSLPNGVCDELIIDRMKKKVTLIQRVEAIPVTSVDGIRLQANLGRYNRFFIHKRQTTHPTFSVSSTGSQLSNWCPHHAGFTTDSYHFYVDGAGDIMLFDKSETLNSIRTKMSQSPFVALHQLATPIVTEIDLEGFPYIYKDGHIFLNSEIAPTVGVEYSLNQGQRIAGQVETLQRHEKQFSKLEQYFADLVYSDYNFALLRFSEKLLQQEGDV